MTPTSRLAVELQRIAEGLRSARPSWLVPLLPWLGAAFAVLGAITPAFFVLASVCGAAAFAIVMCGALWLDDSGVPRALVKVTVASYLTFLMVWVHLAGTN